MREDPLVRLERENKHLREANLRLERESDDLAQELITSKIGLRAELDAAEEKADSFYKELQALKRIYNETEEDRKQIQSEAAKVSRRPGPPFPPADDGILTFVTSSSTVTFPNQWPNNLHSSNLL